MREAEVSAALANVVEELLRSGNPVALDGLGTFRLGRDGRIQFTAEHAPRVFIAYVDEDSGLALRLANALESAGLKPWIDKRRLFPGQDWRRAIERAIDCADFFVACFSRLATTKRGQFPYELRYALRCAERMPLDDNFVIPVRLEACDVPQRIKSTTQYIDVFPDWDRGIKRLTESIHREHESRRNRAAA